MTLIKKFSELTKTELYKILSVRNEVFIVEQNCPYQDLDNKDLDAHHIFMLDEHKHIIAYTRLLDKGVSYKEAPSIGRVLVSQNYRKQGYGKVIMEKTIEFCLDYYNHDSIVISAQEYLLDFYTSLGFERISEMYLEDDIPHIKMVLKNNNA